MRGDLGPRPARRCRACTSRCCDLVRPHSRPSSDSSRCSGALSSRLSSCSHGSLPCSQYQVELRSSDHSFFVPLSASAPIMSHICYMVSGNGMSSAFWGTQKPKNRIVPIQVPCAWGSARFWMGRFEPDAAASGRSFVHRSRHKHIKGDNERKRALPPSSGILRRRW